MPWRRLPKFGSEPVTWTAAGEAPGEVAPHQDSVNVFIILHPHDEVATALRALRNEVGLAERTRPVSLSRSATMGAMNDPELLVSRILDGDTDPPTHEPPLMQATPCRPVER